MLYVRYDVIASADLTSFVFVSKGPKGTIQKVVRYTGINVKDYYNLGFGDKDTINKKMLIAMGGVRALQVNSSICADFEVLSYKVTLTRNDTTFAVINNTGARYNPALLEHFNKVKNNDQVIFSDITVRYFDNKPFGLKILSYKVTE